MYLHDNILLYSFIHLCLSLSLMPSDLSALEGDLVRRRTDLEGVLDRKRLTIQAIATIRSNQLDTINFIKFCYHYILRVCCCFCICSSVLQSLYFCISKSFFSKI